MEQKEWGNPNLNIPTKVNGVTSLETNDSIEHRDNKPMFRSIGKRIKKIAGKRYRIPRKAKKELKKNFCKRGLDIKKLKFSYKRLNRDFNKQ